MSEPAPIEIPFAEGMIRGYEWTGGPIWALLVHDTGRDLDDWLDVPLELLDEGYSVLAIDLPGHGLSDAEWSPAMIGSLIDVLASELDSRNAERRFLVAAGAIGGAMLFAAGERFNAVVTFSPTLSYGPTTAGKEKTPPVLILVGSLDQSATAAADRVFRLSRGWAVVSSLGTEAQGTALLTSDWSAHAREQSRAFLRDYCTESPPPPDLPRISS